MDSTQTPMFIGMHVDWLVYQVASLLEVKVETNEPSCLSTLTSGWRRSKRKKRG